ESKILRISSLHRKNRDDFPILLRIREAEAQVVLCRHLVNDIRHGEIEQLRVPVKALVADMLHIQKLQYERAKTVILLIGTDERKKCLVALLLEAPPEDGQINFLLQF